MLLLLVLMLAGGAMAESRVALYAAMGTEFTRWSVDTARAALEKQESVQCPANIQYVWPHPSRRYLYVAWSDGGPSGAAGRPSGGARHGVTAFRVAADGKLARHGDDLALVSRPVHITVDVAGRYLLVAHTVPSALTVYGIGGDGTLGAEVKQGPLDAGVYAHQVRADPSGRQVMLVTRGNGPAAGRAEDPGALKVYSYRDGRLTNHASIAPGGGIGFQPRHLDFHPTQPWIYLSVERQNELHVYRKGGDGRVQAAPAFVVKSLEKPAEARDGQAASTVHVHPNGRFVYQGNRASGTVESQGKRVFAGGENTIAVYEIDGRSGEPRRLQNIDTRGFSARTFALDPEGKLLVAGNQIPMAVRDGNSTATVAANLAVFRVGADGRLTYVRKYDLPAATDAKSLFWVGLVALP